MNTLNEYTKEISGYRITVSTHYDDYMGPPWKEHDGHGPVSDWQTYNPTCGISSKAPGERVLHSYGSSARFYNFAEAVKIAKRDGWWISDDAKSRLADRLKKPVNSLTKGEIVTEAVNRDFTYLQDWCNDKWRWLGYTTKIIAPDGATHEGDSCWGFDNEDYMISVAWSNAESFVADLIETSEQTAIALCVP